MHHTVNFSPRVVPVTEPKANEPNFRISYLKIDTLRLANVDGAVSYSDNFVFGHLTLPHAEEQLRASARQLVSDGWTRSSALYTKDGLLMFAFTGDVTVGEFKDGERVGEHQENKEVARLWIELRDA